MGSHGPSGGRGMALADLLPESWIENKYKNSVTNRALEGYETMNNRESYNSGS
jgi:hypothetical protein